jgi:hypothetical protein
MGPRPYREASTPYSDECVPTSALDGAVRELAAIDPLPNPTGTELQDQESSLRAKLPSPTFSSLITLIRRCHLP